MEKYTRLYLTPKADPELCTDRSNIRASISTCNSDSPSPFPLLYSNGHPSYDLILHLHLHLPSEPKYGKVRLVPAYTVPGNRSLQSPPRPLRNIFLQMLMCNKAPHSFPHFDLYPILRSAERRYVLTKLLISSGASF